ncbi:TPA: 1-phosphofructokinase family hexose kinase [Candidatus Bipolaricaulota bacterium]|nr:1-phosphofructokinase family hexose kinase [Candidatus Bipolaricaulota bacterium]
MILTVTLNPTLDKFYWVDRLPLSLERVEEEILIRASKSSSSAGGKGINVSVFLACMGVETVAMGFLAGHTGQIILRDVLARGVTANFVWIEGETRTNVTIIERGREYHPVKIHEEGPPVLERAVELFLRKYQRMLKRAEYVVLGGALPPGIPVDFYRELATLAREAGVRTVVHAGGAALKAALEAGPYFVKPDVREEPQVAGLPAKTEQEIIAAGKYALRKGVQACLVSHHVTGDLLITREGVWDLEARVPLSKFKNLVGADDALVAGVLYRLAEGDPLLEAVKFGMAAAIASAEIEPKLCLAKPAIEQEMKEVEVVRKEGG